MDIKCINHTCQGESHKSTGKECQDYSLTWQDMERGITVAIVCDGHGGDSYFRSANGAKIAAEVTLNQVKCFLSDVDKNIFIGEPFTAIGIQENIKEDSKINNVMRQLFLSIYSQWRIAITEDGKRDLTDWEQKNVEKKYLDLLNDEDRIVKAYGCTLMAYICTNDFWFAFHLGDGKMVMLDADCQFSQPVPWDDKCFLNKTTSLCESEPVKDFRFCIQGDGKFPIAMFLGSDGIDDSYGDGPRLNSFYGEIVKELVSKGGDEVKELLINELPIISKKGSQDDMSIAIVYDDSKIVDAAVKINKYQMEQTIEDINALKQKMQKNESIISGKPNTNSFTYEEKFAELLKEFKDKIDALFNEYYYSNNLSKENTTDAVNTKRQMAEVRMAEKELVRMESQMEVLLTKLHRLQEYKNE